MVCKSSAENAIDLKPKRRHRKGLWSPEEDQRLRNYVLNYGHGCWSSVPINAGLQRNGKSCRLRWINYLRPGLKRGMFSAQEEEIILTLHRSLGNKWSQIAQQLPGRTDNEVKNYWHSYLKKKATKVEEVYPNIQSHHSSLSGEILPVSFPIPGYDSTNQYKENGQQSSLPKILFAEWLPLDNNIAQVATTEDQSGSSNYDSNYNNSNMDNLVFDDLLLGDRTCYGEYSGSEPSEGSTLSDVAYSSQFDNICSADGFLLSDDLIFM